MAAGVPTLTSKLPAATGPSADSAFSCSCKIMCLRVGSTSGAFLATERKMMLTLEEELPTTVWVGCRATMRARSTFGVPQ